jgi:hypothetical protein
MASRRRTPRCGSMAGPEQLGWVALEWHCTRQSERRYAQRRMRKE